MVEGVQPQLGPTVAQMAAFGRRWWWLIVGLPTLVAVLSRLLVPPPPVYLQARLSFAVDIPPSAIVAGSDEGTAAKIGEALIDDLSRVISGDVFAEAVAAHLPPEVAVAAGEIASSLSATDRHRIADVTVTRAIPGQATPEEVARVESQLVAIAKAVVTELEQNGNQWFARLGEDQVAVTIIDRPKVAVLPPPLRSRLELPLRTALALVVALGLAAGLHVLDPRLYSEAEAEEAAGAPILGRIPPHSSRRS